MEKVWHSLSIVEVISCWESIGMRILRSSFWQLLFTGIPIQDGRLTEPKSRLSEPEAEKVRPFPCSNPDIFLGKFGLLI